MFQIEKKFSKSNLKSYVFCRILNTHISALSVLFCLAIKITIKLKMLFYSRCFYSGARTLVGGCRWCKRLATTLGYFRWSREGPEIRVWKVKTYRLCLKYIKPENYSNYCAFPRSDVVLLCFSVTSHVSLRNCKATWFPEIRQFCPQTPILLVGCKSDLRYMYRDETYLSFFRDRSPFIR